MRRASDTRNVQRRAKKRNMREAGRSRTLCYDLPMPVGHNRTRWASLDIHRTRMLGLMNNCENRDKDVCLLASSLIGKVVVVCERTCEACERDDNPMNFNKVICSLAYRETKDYEWVDAWNQCNNTFFNKPGSHLRKLLREIGVASLDGCGCDEYAAQMNAWGIQGCLLRRQEIIDHLNAQAYTWMDMAKVALAGYLTTGSLVDECITRAKVLY